MICEPCRVAWHDDCENNGHPAERVGVRPNEGLWCDCQHKAGTKFSRVLPLKNEEQQ